VYEDNTASISMSTYKGSPHKRSKHFGIEWAYFKQAVELLEIKPVYISTNEQPADMLTKALPFQKFSLFRNKIMGDKILQDHFEKRLKMTHMVILSAGVEKNTGRCPADIGGDFSHQ
jgi:hypothetical protein